jgi:hypothetical protein
MTGSECEERWFSTGDSFLLGEGRFRPIRTQPPMAEATCLLQCGAAVNTGENTAGAGILVPAMGRQERGSCCAATWLTEAQANATAAGALAARPFRRYSLLKKPEPGVSAGYAKSSATVFDFR